jgi:hypothetical protein
MQVEGLKVGDWVVSGLVESTGVGELRGGSASLLEIHTSSSDSAGAKGGVCGDLAPARHPASRLLPPDRE